MEEQVQPTSLAGTCKKEEHKCMCEYGLVDVVDGEGKHSQMTVEQARIRMAENESIKKALGE